MNAFRALLAPLAVTFAVGIPAGGASDFDFSKIAPKVTQNVGELLERAHYSRRKLDGALSKQLLKNFLERLDYNRLFFTQKDVDDLNAKYADTLDDAIVAGDTSAAGEIFGIYRSRVEARVAKVKEALKGEFKFSGNGAVELNRQKSPWPKDDADADAIWKDRIEGEMLDRTLMEDKVETPVKVITRRYDQLLRGVHEQNDEDVVTMFLSILSETYDPHSEYMRRSLLDNFNINMSLQLIGIGAVLTSEEGYAKIRELVPGGPASKDGRLKEGDRVCAVAQGDGDFVETVDMKLDKVVEMIRGKENTVVRLRLIPANATDPSERTVVEITRQKVKLKEQEAKAEIIERKLPDGAVQRLGWIVLPSFYADMQRSGNAGAKSTTKDVLVLLERLKKENIQGLVMDLRRNGGGSLEEAVNLTGLFIKKGPVVIAKDSNDRRNILRDKDPKITYDGPMIVLTNKLSASASEIFAAALQDYGRAVVVGDSSTFGKGTVQTMVELGNIIPLSLSGKRSGNEAGALKLTIQKFYRVSGGSTQLKGVISDVKLPSLWDQADIGEGALKGPLPYDTIDAAPIDKFEKELYLEQLKHRSATRVEQDPEFKWINEDIARSKKRVSENKVSLNIASRRAEREDEKNRKKQRKEERAKHKASDHKIYAVTLDNAEKPGLESKVDDKPEKASAKSGGAAEKDDEDEEDVPVGKVDPIRNETVNILRDLIDFTRTATAASK